MVPEAHSLYLYRNMACICTYILICTHILITMIATLVRYSECSVLLADVMEDMLLLKHDLLFQFLSAAVPCLKGPSDPFVAIGLIRCSLELSSYTLDLL